VVPRASCNTHFRCCPLGVERGSPKRDDQQSFAASLKDFLQIIWKIMSFFGTFFKVKNLLIGDDLEKTLGVVTNMYYALYKYSLNSPESLRAGRKFIL